MADAGWEPVATWVTEQPQRCTVCGAVWSGRELGYMPNFCDEDKCPGATDRLYVDVAPLHEAPDG